MKTKSPGIKESEESIRTRSLKRKSRQQAETKRGTATRPGARNQTYFEDYKWEEKQEEPPIIGVRKSEKRGHVRSAEEQGKERSGRTKIKMRTQKK